MTLAVYDLSGHVARTNFITEDRLVRIYRRNELAANLELAELDALAAAEALRAARQNVTDARRALYAMDLETELAIRA